mmetsp:Transcript_31399/g.83543  ORF Transcript_31399/g.83543 Transcript_31399/m.83543 type:complete len:215 (-) Transcript_31399:131-775(-)
MVTVGDDFKKLIEEKDKLEGEIESLSEFLTADGMPGLSGNLVDSEGFPRADVDIYAVRNARQSLACKQNDHMSLMKKIEQALEQLHAESRVSVAPPVTSTASQPVTRDLVSGAVPDLPPAPFAVIDQVSDSSPAHQSGLVVGDQICSFGGVSRSATGEWDDCKSAIAQIVKANVGSAIEVVVLRGDPGERMLLQLIPRTWAGPGLLGCHVEPKL